MAFDGSVAADRAGLWMSPDEREEWLAILRLARAHQLLVFSGESSAALLFPEFTPPTGVWLYPGLPNARELQRAHHQLARATLLVVPAVPIAGPAPNWQELAPALAEFNETEKASSLPFISETKRRLSCPQRYSARGAE